MLRPAKARRAGIVLALCAAAVAPPAARAAKNPAVDDVRDGLPPGVQGAPELGGDTVHSAGAIQMLVTNFGLFGSLPGTHAPYSDAPSAQWPPGSGVEYLFGGGLWVGALKDGQAHVSGILQTPERVQFGFRPGRSVLDHIYRTRELTPGGVRPPALGADDDGDGRVDEEKLNGRDDDGDGLIDEDYAAISDQMFYCEFNDSDPAIAYAIPDHVPLDLHVEQSTLAWGGDADNGCIGFDYRIVNAGREALDDVCVGLYADFDVGNRDRDAAAHDDEVGFWEGDWQLLVGGSQRKIHIAVGYTFDDDGDNGEAEGYVGLAFLGSEGPQDEGIVRHLPMLNYRTFVGTGGFGAGGDPTNDEERYAVLDGSAPRSLAAPGTRPAASAFVLRHPGDYRTVVSAGPFASLPPGGAVRFQAALIIGHGLHDLLDRTARAQLLFDGAWMDCDHDPTTGVDGRETPICGPEHQGERYRLDPCNAACAPNFDPNCDVHVPSSGCIWIDADCAQEAQTNVRTGVDGNECHVTWLGASPPLPPNLRIVPREDRIEIYWDDRSETTPDLQLGVPDFESYRIWRADGWDRPPGTNEHTGPAPSLWSLLGEFDLAGTGVGSETGLEGIRYAPHIPASLVGFYQRWFDSHPHDPPPDVEGFTAAQLDTARALARGRHYYLFVDPPFAHPSGTDAGPCPATGECPQMNVAGRRVSTRCDERGRCAPTLPPPHPGMPLFYAVTTTDHEMVLDNGQWRVVGPGLAGQPGGNFLYVQQPTAALPREQYARADEEIYVVPNPATPATLAPWRLQPNNSDPTGLKVEFHHLPESTGKVTIWTLAGDRVRELQFDGRTGNGTLAWDLVSRNGQDVASGVYLYTVEASDSNFHRFIGKLVVVR